MRPETSLQRQWILPRALSSRHYGLTVQEMANELDVNEKTIRRDLDLCRRLRFPLEEDVGIFGRKTWRIRKDWSRRRSGGRSPTSCNPS